MQSIPLNLVNSLPQASQSSISTLSSIIPSVSKIGLISGLVLGSYLALGSICLYNLYKGYTFTWHRSPNHDDSMKIIKGEALLKKLASMSKTVPEYLMLKNECEQLIASIPSAAYEKDKLLTELYKFYVYVESNIPLAFETAKKITSSEKLYECANEILTPETEEIHLLKMAFETRKADIKTRSIPTANLNDVEFFIKIAAPLKGIKNSALRSSFYSEAFLAANQIKEPLKKFEAFCKVADLEAFGNGQRFYGGSPIDKAFEILKKSELSQDEFVIAQFMLLKTFLNLKLFDDAEKLINNFTDFEEVDKKWYPVIGELLLESLNSALRPKIILGKFKDILLSTQLSIPDTYKTPNDKAHAYLVLAHGWRKFGDDYRWYENGNFAFDEIKKLPDDELSQDGLSQNIEKTKRFLLLDLIKLYEHTKETDIPLKLEMARSLEKIYNQDVANNSLFFPKIMGLKILEIYNAYSQRDAAEFFIRHLPILLKSGNTRSIKTHRAWEMPKELTKEQYKEYLAALEVYKVQPEDYDFKLRFLAKAYLHVNISKSLEFINKIESIKGEFYFVRAAVSMVALGALATFSTEFVAIGAISILAAYTVYAVYDTWRMFYGNRNKPVIV